MSVNAYNNFSLELILKTLVCFIFYRANYEVLLPLLHLVIETIKYMTVSFLIFMYIKNKLSPSPIMILVLLLMVTTFMATLYYDSSYLFFSIKRYVLALGLLAFIEINKDNYRSLYKPIFYSGFLMVIINFLSMLLFPEGLYIDEDNGAKCWFLGQKQSWASTFLIEIVMAFLLWSDKELKPIILLSCLLILSSLTFSLSLGLTLVIILFCIMVFLSRIIKIHIRSYNLTMLFFLIEAALIAFAFNLKKLTFILIPLEAISANSTMSKADTFMARVWIWYDSVKLIIKHPWGNGCISEKMYDKLMEYSTYHPHMHNTLLDATLTGGFLSLLAYIVVLVLVSRRLDMTNTRERDIYVCAMFVFCLLMLTETMLWPYAFGLFLFAYYSANNSVSNSNVRRIKVLSDVPLKSGIRIVLKHS